MVGLDATGKKKTHISYILKLGKVLTTITTRGFEFILFTIHFICIGICTFTCLFCEQNFYLPNFFSYSRSLTISYNNHHQIFKYYQENK